MNLYILRHGLAVEHGAAGYAKDADRPLTAKGKRKLGQIAEAMARLELSFDLILSSPFIRARQTAEIVANILNESKKLEYSETLEPGGSLKQLVGLLRNAKPKPEDVMVVGHEPYLSGLISLLVSGEPGAMVEMKKGGLCKLSISSLVHGRCATLEWLLTPKQMRLIA